MMRVSVKGALTGAAVGGLARGSVAWIHLVFPWGGSAALSLFTLALPSAGIGVLVGLIAGSFRHPATAAWVGAILSGVVFEFFMFACASLIRLFDHDAANRFLIETLIYALEMAAAGALAGLVGSLAGRPDHEDPRPPDPRHDRPADAD